MLFIGPKESRAAKLVEGFSITTVPGTRIVSYPITHRTEKERLGSLRTALHTEGVGLTFSTWAWGIERATKGLVRPALSAYVSRSKATKMEGVGMRIQNYFTVTVRGRICLT